MMATRDYIDDLLAEAKDLADKLDVDGDLVDLPYVGSFLRKISVALLQEHLSLVNEAYRSEGSKPWMRSTRMRKKG